VAVVIPAGQVDTRVGLYDVNGECRAVVKIDGVHIVEEADGQWSIYERRGDGRRTFALLGQAVVAAQAIDRSRDI
jgi:hypothetical protein